ncbi:MAG: oxidoreductase [Actinomycetota bacterium]|nr:oxidoreductase [Actinomycetota bacterium]
MTSWRPEDIGNLDGRVAVITGGNSGIGLEAARMLADAGAHVVLACRDPQRAEQAKAQVTAGGRGGASLGQLDLADLDSVAAFAKHLAAEHDRVDLLVNNAGVMGGPFQTTAQGFERQMGTNHIGHFSLAAQVWPLLTAAPSGRLVVISSIAARGGRLTPATTRDDLVAPAPYEQQAVYANTKQANLLFAQELHRRSAAAGAGVAVLAAHPGVSKTSLFGRQLQERGAGWLVPAAELAMSLVLQSAQAGALPTVRAATDPGATSGSFVGPNLFGQVRGGPELLEVYPTGSDPATAARLWQLTEELLGSPFRV